MAPLPSGDAPIHPRLHLGTSSFSAPSWVGPFYPAGTKPTEFLAVYGRRYETVEIDATFYRIPTAAQVRSWASKVPDGFLIAAKIPQIITHEKKLLGAEAEVGEFLEAMGEAGPKLGPLLFQFPYFRRSDFASEKPFLDRLAPVLASLPSERRFAVEIRNETWVTAPFLSLLRDHGVAFALIDYPGMPTIDQLLKGHDPITADFTYIRWLGDRHGIEAKTDTWEKLIVDREAEMERWVPALAAILERNIEVFGFFNNHYAGHAPGSIALLRDVWRRRYPGG
jgi:uncharacterized protein YecE (DUF72 family)